MKKFLFGSLVFMLVLAACAPQNPTEPPSVGDEQPGQNDSPEGEALSPVESAVVKQLAGNLGLNINDINVIENKSVEFSDGCLGVEMQDAMCAQVITPGRIIVLESNGIEYEYHVNEDGSRIQPATLALTWSREGGIVGFCDRLTVFLSGEVYGNQCKTEDGRMSTFASLLSNQEQEHFFAWMEKYGTMTLDASDPKGVADGMALVLELKGIGKGKPGKADEQALLNWAQSLYQKLYS